MPEFTEYSLGLLGLDIARQVAKVIESEATANSTPLNELVDDIALTQQNGHWDGGTVWMKDSGELEIVGQFAGNTLVFEPDVTTRPTGGGVGAGETYALIDAGFPWIEIRKAINLSLREMGNIPRIDDTLVVDSEEIAYDLPAGVSGIYKVKIVDPDDPKSYYWSEHYREFWQEATGVHSGQIVFDTGYEPIIDDWKIEIYYRARHPQLDAATDEFSPNINREYLLWASIVNLYKWGFRNYGDDSRHIPMYLEEALKRAESLKAPSLHSPVFHVHVAG